MKLPLLSALLLFTVLLHAQDTTKVVKDTLENKKSNEGCLKKDITERQKRFDIGGGVQINTIRSMATFAGPSLSIKANSKYGRIAGIVSLSYNFGNTFQALSFSYYYLNNPYPKSGYHSDIRYNFFKASVAMQVPFFNRTNKKGFGLSMLMGLSYYNGFGSGEYKSFADKPNAPPVDTNFVQQIRPSHKFSFKSNNLALLSFDIGFSATYIFKRYQFFVDGYYMSVWTFNNSYDKGTLHSKSDTDNNFFGTSPRYSFCINFGIRYCLYQPWQVKPPKRG